ncbi:MAG: hypothetical protein ACRECH_14165, partial [Nitrososphaerales archaeon]
MTEEMTERETNLIDDIVAFFDKYIGTPPLFKKAAAYFIISATLGKYVEAIDVPKGVQRPNIWFILGSDPAFTARSTLERYVKEILRQVFVKVNWERYLFKQETKDEQETEGLILRENESLVQDVDEKKRKALRKLFDDHIIETGSPEGIADHVQRTSDWNLLIGSEYGENMVSITDTKSYYFG